jgi:uncharacterized protein YjbJ (UPF0337 family)
MQDPQTEGKLDQVRGKIRATWGKLTDDDFEQARGNVEALIGKIKERTGESVESIRERINEMMHHEGTKGGAGSDYDERHQRSA